MNIRQPLAILGACAVALWPIWLWYPQAAFRTGRDPIAIMALAVIPLLLRPQLSKGSVSMPWMVAATVILFVYAASYHATPFLFSAALGLTAFGLVAIAATKRPTRALATLSLLGLSMPIFNTLQFFFGYPMRALSADLACLVFRCGGLEVTRRGVSLVFSKTSILIDPACSGLRTMWTVLFVAAVFSLFKELKPWKAVCLHLYGVILAIVISAARAVILSMWQLSPYFDEKVDRYFHAGVGLIAFAVVAVVLGVIAKRMQKSLELTVCA